jgi:hypothetical protein
MEHQQHGLVETPTAILCVSDSLLPHRWKRKVVSCARLSHGSYVKVRRGDAQLNIRDYKEYAVARACGVALWKVLLRLFD